MILFSVVIPTCNRNRSLECCLSRLKPNVQSLPSHLFEVIVSDDSQNGSSKELLDQLFPWVKWSPGPRQGPAANRNNGAKSAKGEWLVFVDDDCLPDKDWLSSLLPYADSFQVIEGRTFTSSAIKSPLYFSPTNETGGHLWSCNFAIKKNLFNQVGGFDETFPYPNLEDNDLKKRIDQNQVNILFVKEFAVEHPLRRMSSPRRLSKYHESWLYYFHKHGEKKTKYDLLITIFKTRIAHIRRFSIGFDSLLAIGNMIAELALTAANPKINAHHTKKVI